MKNLSYPIGMWKQPVALTDVERASAIETLAATPAELRSAVAGLDDEQLDTTYRPDGWTVRQVVHHLPDSHLNAYVRFKLGVTEDLPTIRPYREAAWAELPDSQGPIEVSLRLLDAVHERWVGLLLRFSDAHWERQIDHPEIGRLRLDALLSQYAWHGPHHVAHITALRARMGW